MIAGSPSIISSHLHLASPNQCTWSRMKPETGAPMILETATAVMNSDHLRLLTPPKPVSEIKQHAREVPCLCQAQQETCGVQLRCVSHKAGEYRHDPPTH